MLYVHRKEWEAKDHDYSVRRHAKILRDKYDAGERSPRNLFYLADFARFLWPSEELKFLHEGRAAAVTPLDRYRTAIMLANRLSRDGLYL